MSSNNMGTKAIFDHTSVQIYFYKPVATRQPYTKIYLINGYQLQIIGNWVTTYNFLFIIYYYHPLIYYTEMSKSRQVANSIFQVLRFKVTIISSKKIIFFIFYLFTNFFNWIIFENLYPKQTLLNKYFM